MTKFNQTTTAPRDKSVIIIKDRHGNTYAAFWDADHEWVFLDPSEPWHLNSFAADDIVEWCALPR